jgi:hypothetical protein
LKAFGLAFCLLDYEKNWVSSHELFNPLSLQNDYN